VLGPVSAGEILGRIRNAQERPHLVWTPAMSEWTDARTLPQFSAGLRRKDAAESAGIEDEWPVEREHESFSRRARHELISYLAISGYLFIWLSAVMFYKAAILSSVGIEFAPFGLAAVKALILGKFILVLEALKIGEGRESGILVVQILWRALLFTLLLIVLSIVEELIVGHFHGREPMEVLRGIGGGTVPQAIASGVLMFLVLLPYLAFRRLALTFGELPELLFTRHLPSTQR
jgi:hypothetical protein